jgi:hypothetical protein
MATKINHNVLAVFLGLSLVATGFFACSKDDDDDDSQNEEVIYNLSGNANGGQEFPNRVTTTATGTLTGTYNATTNLLTYTITWNGISAAPTGFHFHGPADPGASAGIVVPITGFPAATAGTHSGTATLTDAQETDLLAFKWYYNIHTPTNGGGEIRGQVFPMRQ